MTLLISIGIRILEILFFAGWIGSAVVILWSLIDYIAIFLRKDDSGTPPSPVIQEPTGSS